MRRLTLGILGLASGVSLSTVACPDFLNTEMRKLASSEVINFCEAYGDKPLLIVNTASNCGYTHQLAGLEQVHQRYQPEGADAVVGVDLDYSEFSGGGRSMLFIVANGTAVKLQ